MNHSNHLHRLPAGLALAVAPCIFLLINLLSGLPARGDSVLNSPHNLTATGTGSIKSGTTNNVCIFCHTVHKANGVTPLWNHTMSSVSNYVVYSSTRLNNLGLTVPQPNGSSRLCLSCHDGTVALGRISSSAAPVQLFQNGIIVTTMPGNRSSNPNYLGTDLSGDHPVSMDYDAAAQADVTLKSRATLNPLIKLEPLNGKNYIQCTSCHNPHDDKNGNFLVIKNDSSALCVVCHQPDQWTTSAHALSSTPVPQAILAKRAGGASASAKAVAANSVSTSMRALGCENCHMNHRSGAKQHLLQSAVPEQNCLVCHNGRTVQKNLAADFQKPSIHPITLNSQTHSSVEDPINPKTRHVVCADCHNSHAAIQKKAAAPNASGALAGVTGVTAAGGVIKPVLNEYELCFRCHADSVARGPATVTRQYPETNTRLQFSVANQSYHPVERAGKNPNSVPSLIAPWTVNSLMYCTDCHNSDSGSGAGGAGANGPHGSIFAPILERNLVITDNQSESTFAYALCYKCHDRSRVLSNQSFRFHSSHIVNDKAACTTCHDSHGAANSPHLINFNTTYVTASSLGTINYTAMGTFKGVCTLTCHGYDHKNTAY